MMSGLLGALRRFWWAAAAAAAVVWLSWPSPGSPADPAAPTRQYLELTACLLTGAGGVGANPAAAAWSGVRESSLATRARVSYLPVFGPATEAAALPYLASLVQRHCAVVVAVGAAQDAAVAADAARFPQVRFFAVNAAAPAAHVTRISAPSARQVEGAVSAAVTAAIRQAPG